MLLPIITWGTRGWKATPKPNGELFHGPLSPRYKHITWRGTSHFSSGFVVKRGSPFHCLAKPHGQYHQVVTALIVIHGITQGFSCCHWWHQAWQKSSGPSMSTWIFLFHSTWMGMTNTKADQIASLSCYLIQVVKSNFVFFWDTVLDPEDKESISCPLPPCTSQGVPFPGAEVVVFPPQPQNQCVPP